MLAFRHIISYNSCGEYHFFMHKSTDLLLKEKNIRPTQIRREILRLFIAMDYALSHSDINMFIGADFDPVTIYRTLTLFESKGLIHNVHEIDRTIKYAYCKNQCNTDGHHDNHPHFHCEQCKQVYCIYNVPIRKMDFPMKFREKKSIITSFGVCETCNK